LIFKKNLVACAPKAQHTLSENNLYNSQQRNEFLQSNIAPLNLDNHTLSEPTDLDIVAIAKAIGDDLRANILRALARDSFGVMELSKIFAVAQPALSHHLKILKLAGLATSRREGTSIFYQRAAFSAQSLPASLFRALDQTPLPAVALLKVGEIYAERAHQSASFFHNNADVLDHQSELICPPEVFIPYIVETIAAHNASSRLASNTHTTNTLLEVGPGNCTLLAALASQFDQAIGIDNSQSMLNVGLAQLQLSATANTQNISLQQKDFYQLPNSDTYDVIVAAMVLHHMPSPDAFFNQIKKLLKPNGLLVLAELCPHTQEKAKTLCGDFWLGFAPEILQEHAAKNGLKVKAQQYLAQRNGFRVQIPSFELATPQPSLS
jgi:2-polyprenyl-3-methyl-5-hydroxy-6-metoxy-1,4-benzoquinol methylase/DNA-binding transcriptional ArsR family regulator